MLFIVLQPLLHETACTRRNNCEIFRNRSTHTKKYPGAYLNACSVFISHATRYTGNLKPETRRHKRRNACYSLYCSPCCTKRLVHVAITVKYSAIGAHTKKLDALPAWCILECLLRIHFSCHEIHRKL